MVIDDSKYKKVIALSGSQAQSILNLIQAVCLCFIYFVCCSFELLWSQRLDFPIDPQHKPRHIKALLKLSRASGIYPECLVLAGIEMDEHPVAQGGFGDVHKGQIHGKQFAVKVLRIYQDTDAVKLRKVTLDWWTFVCVISFTFTGIFFWGCLMATTFTSKCFAFLWGLSSRQGDTETLLHGTMDGKWECRAIFKA